MSNFLFAHFFTDMRPSYVRIILLCKIASEKFVRTKNYKGLEYFWFRGKDLSHNYDKCIDSIEIFFGKLEHTLLLFLKNYFIRQCREWNLKNQIWQTPQTVYLFLEMHRKWNNNLKKHNKWKYWSNRTYFFKD